MKTPRAMYRLQLHAGFGFDDAAAIAGYLRDLGVSHVYCSPYLQAAPGRMHGYDVVDYHHINEELGGEEGHRRFCQALEEAGLGQILDIVPNHMAITGSHNAWWWDILENGPVSRYAPYFDVEWNPPEEKLRNKMLLPVLGERYGRALAGGDLKLERDGGSFQFRYHEYSFPAAPESMAEVLAAAADTSGLAELGFLAGSLARLPGSGETDWASLFARHRDKEAIRELLTRLCERDARAAREIDAEIGRVNADPDRMDPILSRQNYRLAYWRAAERDLGYRRFFDVNSLVGLRMSNERVFADTHSLVLKLLRDGSLDGVRVDHPDGLRDPGLYFRRLRASAPDAWIVAEKILEWGETPPASWPVAGTTGYEFLNLAGGLFVDSGGEAAMNEIYRDFTGDSLDYAALMREKKTLVLQEILGSDVNRLTAAFLRICERDRDRRDVTRHEVHEAIRETIACFPVYRTYAQAESGELADRDAAYIGQAVDAAKAGRADLDGELFEFLRDVLLLRTHGADEADFAMRFQQLTGAAMAKGVEDTLFYCFNRLAALNEVGGDPSHFGVSADDFHRCCGDALAHWPDAMLAGSTHDTKRSEDVRARLYALSEMPAAWGDAVRRWTTLAAPYRTDGLPDRNTEYLLYQTMVGAWPISEERLRVYMEKATREAKRQTSWTSPNAAFEDALHKLVGGLFGDADFMREIDEFVETLAGPGRVNSLSQTLLRMTAPGVPDIYQGTELWDLSLVDPDNRRPVDFDLRRKLLAGIEALSVEDIAGRGNDGLPKLWVIRQCLRARRLRAESFGANGTYTPLWATGSKAQHVVAFQRGGDIAAIAPRLTAALDGKWESTFIEIPEGAWTNQFTGDVAIGGKLELANLLARFPVALLVREETEA